VREKIIYLFLFFTTSILLLDTRARPRKRRADSDFGGKNVYVDYALYHVHVYFVIMTRDTGGAEGAGGTRRRFKKRTSTRYRRRGLPPFLKNVIFHHAPRVSNFNRP